VRNGAGTNKQTSSSEIFLARYGILAPRNPKGYNGKITLRPSCPLGARSTSDIGRGQIHRSAEAIQRWTRVCRNGPDAQSLGSCLVCPLKPHSIACKSYRAPEGPSKEIRIRNKNKGERGGDARDKSAEQVQGGGVADSGRRLGQLRLGAEKETAIRKIRGTHTRKWRER